MKKLFLSFCFAVFSILLVTAQFSRVEKSEFVYKTIDGTALKMVMYRPQVPQGIVNLPAMVFFFGGGWVSGSPAQFDFQANYLASRGIVVFCPEYRIRSKHGTTPFESVKDAKSAIRYLKLNAQKLGIDSAKIVAGGGSAGGHLAACTAIIANYSEKTDDLSVSSVPMALVLFNPVVDTGKRGYGQEKLQGKEFELSPVHHITSGVPPTLIMHGKADTTVPVENVRRFREAMKQQGNKCILVEYKNQGHGFFNYNRSPKYFKKTLKKTESFLEDFGLLRGESWVSRYCKQLKSQSNQN